MFCTLMQDNLSCDMWSSSISVSSLDTSYLCRQAAETVTNCNLLNFCGRSVNRSGCFGCCCACVSCILRCCSCCARFCCCCGGCCHACPACNSQLQVFCSSWWGQYANRLPHYQPTQMSSRPTLSAHVYVHLHVFSGGV